MSKMGRHGTAGIEVEDVSLDFPLYHSNARSLKKMVMSTVAGRMAEDAKHRVVVKALRDIGWPGEVFEAAGGFDELLPVAFNDVDYCLKLRDQGYLIVYTPLAELVQRVGAGYAAATGDATHGHAAALRQLWSLTWREAQVQTYADAFLLITLCFVIATAMVPLMRKVAPRQAAPADAH